MLKELRQRAGLTQEALATKAGITAQAIYLFESGRANPSLATLRRIADTLGCTPGDLLAGEAAGGAA